MTKCIIIGAGEAKNTPSRLDGSEYIIAADAGYKICLDMGITPNLAIGDWDSLKEPSVSAKKITLPAEKNDTDTLFAIRTALDKGFEEIHLLCCTGGRLDHTFANLQCLLFLSKAGKIGFLYDGESVVTAITNGSLRFPEEAEGIISVFAADGTAGGVSETNLKYPLENAEIFTSFPIGVSNEFIGKSAIVEVKNGSLFIFFPRKYFPEILKNGGEL